MSPKSVSQKTMGLGCIAVICSIVRDFLSAELSLNYNLCYKYPENNLQRVIYDL